MNTTLKAGLATATLAVAACFSMTAIAADLGRGSIKDGYIPSAPAPAYGHAPTIAGPCYLRSDAGYSWSRDPSAEWVGNTNPAVRTPDLDNGYFFEGGLGCGMGSRGFRGEMMLGVRESKKFRGDVDVIIPNIINVDPPIHTEVKSYTMMFNAYHDLGKVGGFVPYVGAGLGWAYHKMGNVTIDHALTPNIVHGEDKLSFAWSLMAGVGYQLTDRAVLDVGYRFIDLGLARGSHGDNVLAWNPRLEIDDQRSHEFKVGVRYHLGSADCCAQQYAPMK